MISIIIPVYNQAKKLLLTLASINQQTFIDFEVIIVNDGSTDGVEQLFAAQQKNVLNLNSYLFLNQNNQGAPAARNRGFQASRGEYLFFCDADAILHPQALQNMLKYLQDNPTVSYVYPSFKWGNKLFKVGDFNANKLRQGPCIHTMALIRRSDFPNSAWDESIKKFQDWDLWLTMLEEGKVGLWLPQVLFTVSPGGSISNWLPRAAYKFLPFLKRVKKYQAALKIIQKKHGLISNE